MSEQLCLLTTTTVFDNEDSSDMQWVQQKNPLFHVL